MDLARLEQSAIRPSYCTTVSLHQALGMDSCLISLLKVGVSNASDTTILTNVLVVVDHHEYQVFNLEQIAFQPWQHRQAVCNDASAYSSNVDKWVVGKFNLLETAQRSMDFGTQLLLSLNSLKALY